ncbi:MAG: hypothetical protein LC117_05185 [Bacteroidia bacterium]|nr:hypothetical protein [Bacteroidia bacterium]MCZ2277305.1 hypothetical protein [Bacteroidia bacterium]
MLPRIALTTILSSTLLMLNPLKGQPVPQEDPLAGFKNFFEIGISVSAVRINTEFTRFQTLKGDFEFRKNHYQPSIDADFSFGWLINDKSAPVIWRVNTGVNLLNRNAELTDGTGRDLLLSTGYLQVPLQVGLRSPLKFNTIRNYLFRAFEFSAGLYAATPFMQKLDLKDNLDSKADFLGFNYFKFGLIGEVAFTAFSSSGNGHKAGLRVSLDFATMAKLSETEYQLYPYYYSAGLFYILINEYK